MPPKESSYYPAVQGFLRRSGYVCESKDWKRRRVPFITKGIQQIIVDVFGIKSANSIYSTELEVASVEVKRSTGRASLRNMYQALNSNKIAHYCYLAMPRIYSERERTAAAELGIGLLMIGRGDHVRLVSQSRRFQPDPALIREFLRRNLSIAQCSICRSFTNLYDIPKGQNREGGGWRKNVFSPKRDKWAYFCAQCRERFENVLTERRTARLQRKLKTLEGKYKSLGKQLRHFRRKS